MIDFTIPEEIQQVRARVAAFIDAYVLPAEAEIGTRPYFAIVADLQAKARAAGLWCPFIPAEWGGMGLGHLANAVVQIEVGRSPLAAWAMNCMGPQDATMLTLLDHGTAEQKERFLVPLVNGERRICFSMTERAAGSDATGIRTTAVRDGEDWILNGEKWFSSSASISDYALVMARTDADARQAQAVHHVPGRTARPWLPDHPGHPDSARGRPAGFGGESTGGHAEVRIRDLRVPHANVIGEVGGGFAMGQHRLGYGRLRHGMWSIAKAQRALDMAAAHALERETFGRSCWRTGRGSSGCSPTAPVTCTSPD